MPDEPRLAEPQDFVPKLVGYAAQGIGPRLPKGSLEKYFGKDTSLVDKFSFLWDSEVTHEAIVVESEYAGKDKEKAAEFRQKGNDYFKKKSYLSAMEMYSQCIIHAPQGERGSQKEETGGSTELALAYNNRSAALFHLKKYEMCLRDTDLALESGYPEQSHYKLQERRGKCFYAMKRRQAALQAYCKAEEALQKASLDEKSHLRVRQELSRQREITEQLIQEKDDHTETDQPPTEDCYPHSFQSSYNPHSIPNLHSNTNPTHPHASSSLHIQYNQDKGRHAIAKQDVHIGSPLVVEKPYSAVLLPEYRPDHCSECLGRVIVPVPCRQCVSVVYCGLACEKKAWESYHKYECSYFVLFEQDWVGCIGHLAHRLVLTTGIDRLLHYMEDLEQGGQENNINAGMSKEGLYHNDSQALFRLMSNVKERDEASLLQLSVFAILLAKVIKASGYLKDQSLLSGDYDNEKTIKLLGGALLYFLQVNQCNAKSVMEMFQPTDFESVQPKCIGTGLYLTAALLNHSCYPNTELIFHGDTLVARATRSIFEGEEICCSYGPNFYMTSRFRRMKSLSSSYFFVCECEACTEKWAMWKDIEKEYPDFSCAACHKYCDPADIRDKTYLDCPSCAHSMNVHEAWGQLTVSHDEYAKAVEDAMHLRVDRALPALASHLHLMQTYLRMPWKDMLICEVGVQNCYKMMGNKKVQFAV